MHFEPLLEKPFHQRAEFLPAVLQELDLHGPMSFLSNVGRNLFEFGIASLPLGVNLISCSTVRLSM